MNRRIIFICFAYHVAMATSSFAQTFSTCDSTTVFKNREGKILNKEEVTELMKTTFSLLKENPGGRQVITILPADNTTNALRNASIEAFRAGLINKPLHGFHLPGLNYQVWDSEQMRGRVLVMNIWFTTCGPCIREIPVLNELVSVYKKKNVVFIAPAPENKQHIKRFLKKNSFRYNLIPAAQDYIKSLQVENFPTHLIVDKKGVVREVFTGYEENLKERLQEEIEKLLKEKW